MIKRGNDTDDELDDDYKVHDLETSWWNWIVWRFFEKHALPFSGGFMEQPTWVIEDMMTIEAQYHKVKELING